MGEDASNPGSWLKNSSFDAALILGQTKSAATSYGFRKPI